MPLPVSLSAGCIIECVLRKARNIGTCCGGGWGGGEVEVGGGGSLVAQTLGRLNLETLCFFSCVLSTFDDGSNLGQ